MDKSGLFCRILKLLADTYLLIKKQNIQIQADFNQRFLLRNGGFSLRAGFGGDKQVVLVRSEL